MMSDFEKCLTFIYNNNIQLSTVFVKQNRYIFTKYF